MEIKEFVDKIKEAKKTFKESYEYTNDLKVKVDKKRINYILSKKETCNHCGHTRKYFLTVTFNEKQEQLTIFEAGLLFSLFVKNELVKDYHNYHKCIAGIRFIENIKKVDVIRP